MRRLQRCLVRSQHILLFVLAAGGWTAMTGGVPFESPKGGSGHWGAPEAKDGAWVFVAAIGDLTRHYIDLLYAGMQCLQNTNTKYDMVLLYEGELPEDVQLAFHALNVTKVYRYPDYFNAKNIDITSLDEKSRPALEENNYWYKCWNKLAAWTLTKYQKVVVLDPDVIAWEHSDEVFEYPELSAAPDYMFQTNNREHLDTFNSGFMVIEPSMHTFRNMSDILPSYTSWFVDQGFLNDFFKHEWHPLPIAYQLWPTIIANGWGTTVVKFVHHVSESACWECDLGHKTYESCKQHVCPHCCWKVVKCREEAHGRINEFKKAQRHT